MSDSSASQDPAGTKEPAQFSLATAMTWLQEDLVGALTMGRQHLPHPDEVGDNAELHWMAMLRCFLPRRYSVGTAFVVDVNGRCSEQLDVVIFDEQYTPRIFQRGETCYIPAESVYAVFESKQDLTKEHVVYAGRKAASVRRLERTSAPIPHAGGKFEAKKPPPIIAGLLTHSSGWDPPFGKPFATAVSAAAEEERLDLGCVATAGSFELRSRDGELALDVWRSRDRALVWFVTRLLSQLQAAATVPAIDIVKWADRALQPGAG